MYIKKAALRADLTDTSHYRSSADDRLMVTYGSKRYGFRTNEERGTAEPRGGLIDEPIDIEDVPQNVLMHVRTLGYRICGDAIRTDVVDVEKSDIEGYELWV